MRKLVAYCFLLLLALLTACSSDVKKDLPKDSLPARTDSSSKKAPAKKDSEAAKKDTVVQRKEAPIRDGIACYYLLNDKENTLADSAGLSEWIKKRVDQVEHFGISENLFSHKGGGPNGAEWNANAGDMLIVVTSPEYLYKPDFSLSLNDKKYEPVRVHWRNSKTKKGSIAWFVLPASQWYPRLRAIHPSDYQGLYGDSALKANSFVAPLNTGKVVSVCFNASCTPPANASGSGGNAFIVLATGYIHAAEGE